MKKLIGALAAGLLLAGCAMGPMSDGGAGTVVDRDKDHRIRCSLRSCYTYRITTERDGSGTRDTGQVSEKVYNRCQVGDRWPDCKKEGR